MKTKLFLLTFLFCFFFNQKIIASSYFEILIDGGMYFENPLSLCPGGHTLSYKVATYWRTRINGGQLSDTAYLPSTSFVISIPSSGYIEVMADNLIRRFDPYLPPVISGSIKITPNITDFCIDKDYVFTPITVDFSSIVPTQGVIPGQYSGFEYYCRGII
jgi:hypothetical protein